MTGEYITEIRARINELEAQIAAKDAEIARLRYYLENVQANAGKAINALGVPKPAAKWREREAGE